MKRAELTVSEAATVAWVESVDPSLPVLRQADDVIDAEDEEFSALDPEPPVSTYLGLEPTHAVYRKAYRRALVVAQRVRSMAKYRKSSYATQLTVEHVRRAAMTVAEYTVWCHTPRRERRAYNWPLTKTIYFSHIGITATMWIHYEDLTRLPKWIDRYKPEYRPEAKLLEVKDLLFDRVMLQETLAPGQENPALFKAFLQAEGAIRREGDKTLNVHLHGETTIESVSLVDRAELAVRSIRQAELPSVPEEVHERRTGHSRAVEAVEVPGEAEVPGDGPKAGEPRGLRGAERGDGGSDADSRDARKSRSRRPRQEARQGESPEA